MVVVGRLVRKIQELVLHLSVVQVHRQNGYQPFRYTKRRTPALGNGDPSTLVLICLFFSGWWETKHSQPPDILQVINTVQNSSFNTRKMFSPIVQSDSRY